MSKILLIEDDDVKAKDIMDFIDKEYHFDIDRKNSITAGLRVINSDYDYILLDMSLPRFSENSLRNFEPFGGLQVIKEIERKQITTEIIVITQYALFGEGNIKKTLDDIKKQCLEYKVNLKDVIKYSRDSSSWKEQIKMYL